MTIAVRDSERTIQDVVNHAKGYVAAANRGYEAQQNERAAEEERQLRAKYEKEVADAQLRRNILSKIKL